MAEAANNIIPLNGSPLSRGSRENISANVTSFNSFISEQKNFNSQKTRADDYQNVLIQDKQSSIISLQNQLDGISKELSSLSLNVNTISRTIQEDAGTEQLRLRSEQENQKRLAERRIAIGREDELEQRIQSSLSSPIVSVQAKVSDLFSRVESAFTTLFLGWLSNSVIDYLKAQSEGDSDKLNQIKFTILKGLAIGVGSLVAVKTGFSLVGRAISAVTSGITSLIAKLAAAPFRALGAGIRSLGGGTKPPAPTKPGRKPGGGLGFGKLISALSGAMNLNNKEYVDATLAGLSLFAKAPGVVGGIAKIAGVAFTIDEIAEAFGSNVFGDSRDKIVNDAAQVAKREKEKQNKPSPTAQVSADKVSVSPKQTNNLGQSTPSQTQVKPAANMAPQGSDLMMNVNTSPIQISSTSESNIDTSPTPPQIPQQQLSDYSGIFERSEEGRQLPQPRITPAAQISAPPKDTLKIESLPEVQPNVIVATDTNAAASTPQQQPRPQVNPDVPTISSSNPDNFYVLYSQLNYNVVM
jgi:hypothetical protein